MALAALDRLPETTDEIRLCCADLKVLGRKEFKLLLKWRLRVREIFGFPTKKTAKTPLAEEVAVVENMDEELMIQEELQRIKDKESSKKKKERRKENEKRQKEIVRMQMNMTAPMDIGMEQEGPMGDGSMFRLKALDQTDAMRRIAKGKMTKVVEADTRRDRDSGIGSSGDTDEESDEDGDRLEQELDNLYDDYRERKAASDAKYRAKKARKEHGDDEWEGVSGSEKEDSDDDDVLQEDSSDESDSEDGDDAGKSLLRDLDSTPNDESGLSKRARGFFNQDIFQSIPGLLDELELEEEEGSEDDAMDVDAEEDEEDDDEEEEDEKEEDDVVDESEEDASEESDDGIPTIEEQRKRRKEKSALKAKKDNGKFEVAREAEEDDWEETDKKAKKDGKPSKSIYVAALINPPRLTYLDIDIVTAEAMTLAHQLALGEKSVHDIMDEGYNKYAFKDRDGLPDWFLDDEGRHDKPHKPITKEAAAAIKEKLRAYNARPIKKVAEARARKKFKQAQKLEKLKKKADLLAGDEVCRPSPLLAHLASILTGFVGHVGEGEGYQHRQAYFGGRAQEEEAAGQGGQGPGSEPWSVGQAQGCQGQVQDGGPAHEEGDAGAEAGREEEVRGECSLICREVIVVQDTTSFGTWICDTRRWFALLCVVVGH